jgi:acyl-coenzyme A thioesterase PaaI-like protein
MSDHPPPSFAEAMRLTAVDADAGHARFGAHLTDDWTIGPKVHGGMMLALCANAARTVIGADGVEPIAVSGNYLWAPDPGDMWLTTTVRKRGRRVNLVDVELGQADRVAVRAAVTLAVPEHRAEPLLSANPVVALMPPEPPPGLVPIGPDHPMADVVHLARGIDIRPSLRTMQPRTDGGPPVIQYWVRPRDCPSDVLFAIVCGDVSAPVTFGVNRFGWAPTVQLTAYLRGLPADGWLRVLCTTVEIGQEWFDEDHVVVDAEGRIVLQSRQLALVPPAS